MNLSILNTSSSGGRVIKSTTSRCPVCIDLVPAEIAEIGGQVVMNKRCPNHGAFSVVIAKNPKYYFDSRGSSGSCCGEGGCCAPVSDTSVAQSQFETLSTCIALIEIVDSCNLTCPTCFASSPWGINQEVDCRPLDEIKDRVQSVLDRKGFIDILQLSGGEPTIHPQFFEILCWAIENPKIGYILINTNAVRIAKDEEFREQLGTLRRSKGKFELYVQFDGTQVEGQRELRGADLRQVRQTAIDGAGAVGVPSTLAMVVTPTTIAHLGDTLRFALERPHCRGMTLQPMFSSGRLPAESKTLPMAYIAPAPISVGDCIVALSEQSRGLMSEEDFTPLPCGDPNCHTISYLLRLPGGPQPLSKLIDVKAMQGFLSNRVDYRLEDLARCGCESEPLGDIIKGLELRPESPFRIFIKPFMDAWTFDQDRIDRCCTHVIKRDGTLDSFCHYYLTGGAAGH